MKRSLLASTAVAFTVALVLSAALFAQDDNAPPDVRLATGVRVGEVDQTSAIVWVRLTASAQRLSAGKSAADVPPPPATDDDEKDGANEATKDAANETAQKRRPPPLELPEGWRADELEGACPGAPGVVRVSYAAESSGEPERLTSERVASAEGDFVVQFPLRDLRPGTSYRYRVLVAPRAGGDSTTAFEGHFRTAPAANVPARVTFTVVTGMMYRDLDHRDGFHIYPAMGALDPDFIVPTGDTVYYDSEWPRARGVPLARYHWHRMYSLPRLVEFHRNVPGYWMKDDHDTLDDDCWPGKTSGKVAPLTFADGQSVFLEQTPMGERTYRTVRWGKHLQVWLVEGRDFRSPNTDDDGSGKTIWGEEQKRWLAESVRASDATFRVLVSATPIVGPDRPRGKNDNHSNDAFETEGEAFRRWAREHLDDRFYVVCGDRHWQYHSVDPVSGVQEFSCGPASDKHAGGTPGFDFSRHKFHRVKGGFLSVNVGEDARRPFIAFRFHDVHGAVMHEYREDAVAPRALPTARAADAPPASKGLYDALLEEARSTLAARAEAIAALTEPDAIAARRERIRASLLESFGGFPERTPLAARVTGRLERDDHVMEKVIFESRPGFHVTANLYLPKSAPPHPVVLFPCGHSDNGKAGSTYQTAGQELARRGLATFVFDPIGQGERFQFLDDDGKPVVGNTTEHTLTGTAALLVGSSTAAVIIWDGIRAVDYLATRDDLDLDRLGCTGNSGGGTQTSYLMALEPRIRAAAPSCYLTSLTRLLETIGPQDAEQNFTGFIAAGLDHADFVHAFAPRPALICCASGDYFDVGGTWATFREAKRIYGRLGRSEAVDLVEVDARHGYHPPIRQRVGRFFERTLLGRADDAIVDTVAEGTVYPDAELRCTETGQVVSSLEGRTVADLWLDAEATLRPERERRFREMPREEWLGEVRRLAGMADEVHAPIVDATSTSDVAGVKVTAMAWAKPFPATATLFEPRESPPSSDGERDGPRAVELVASELPIESFAPRLLGRARTGEVILAVELPGYGAATPSNSRNAWGNDWKEAFLAFHLDRTLAGIRADALRQAVALARGRFPGREVRVVGTGLAAVPALLASVMTPEVSHLRLERGLDSWASVVADGLNRARLGNTVPRALAHFDLPLLREAMGERVEHVVPTNPHGGPLERSDGFVRLAE